MKLHQVTEIEMDTLKSMTIGKRLKWIREQLQDLYLKGYSINQVANNINSLGEDKILTPQGLSAIETDKTKNPNAKTINALAEYYRISNKTLFDDYYTNNGNSFQLGDVDVLDSNATSITKAHLHTCHISLFADDVKYSETLKLSSKQIDLLLKRIEFEVSLLRE